MDISDYSFHDATILEAKELIGNQTIEYLIDFPIDWENNVFEHRILRFIDVTHYVINEIPFDGQRTILDVNDLGIEQTVVGSGRNEMNFERNRVELITNAGNRIIHYLNCDLLPL